MPDPAYGVDESNPMWGVQPRYPRVPPPGLSDEAVALNYYRQRALDKAGWTPEATQWANQIPISVQPINDWATGVYWPGKPGSVEIANLENPMSDDVLSQVVEHEMMHAYDYTNNIKPTLKDYTTALEQQPFIDKVKELIMRQGWKGEGTPTWGYYDNPDYWHYTHSLFQHGMNSQTVPDWYKQNYLSEYK
jgi:hypothetical protein